MKIKIILFILILSVANASAQTSQKLLNETILKIVDAYRSKDANTFNSYINKDWGISLMFQRGVIPTYQNVAKIDFNKPIPDYLPYDFSMAKTSKINLSSKPKYDCGAQKWNVPAGIYYHKPREIDNIYYLNKKLKAADQYNEGINSTLARAISKDNYMVFAINIQQDAFIFYLTPRNGKYYITAITRFDFCGA